MNRLRLKGVPKTLLISLNVRCNETIHPRGLISDLKSLEIAKRVGSDFRNERSVHLTKLNFSWLDSIPKDKPVFLSAEGLFCYFTQQEVKQVLVQVAKVFSKAEFVIEAVAPFMVKNTKQHPSIKGFDAQFRWGIDSGKILDDWGTGFHFVDEEFFMEMKECKQRSLMVRLFCLSKQFAKSMKIFRLRNYVEH